MVNKMQRLTMNNSDVIAKRERSYPAIFENSERGDEGEGTDSAHFLTLSPRFCVLFFSFFIFLFFPFEYTPPAFLYVL